MAKPYNCRNIIFFYTILLSITTTNTFSFITTPSFGSSQKHHTSKETGRGGLELRQFHSLQRSPLSSSSLILLSSSPSSSSSLTPPPPTAEQQDDDDDDTSWRQCIKEPSPPISTPLNDAVSLIANVSLAKANELIDIGAVWAQMELLTDDDLLEQYDNSDDSSLLSYYADLPKGWSGSRVDDDDDDGNDSNAAIDVDYYDDITNRRNTRFRRILTPVIIPPHTPLRIYPHPRRFPSCSQLSSSSSQNNPRLLYEDTTFIVVDKPPMLPTQPDASNYYECCPGCVNDHMGPFRTIDGALVKRPLICHRVDSCVGGVVVLSKDEKGQGVFSEFQRDRKIKKLYLAVTRQPVPLGLHAHWMFKASTARGSTSGPPCQLLSHETPPSRKSRKAWIRCLLEVTSCTPITIPPNPTIYTPPSSSSSNNNDEIKHYQSTIRLVTGRKHQIRAQLSSLGCPIINDSLYEPIAGLTLDQLSHDDDDGDAEDRLDRAVEQCRVPTKPIGLQAAGILFGGIKVRAGPPWWHG